MVRPERLELPAYWFEASRSIQLSYGRAFLAINLTPIQCRIGAPAIDERFDDFIKERKAGRTLFEGLFENYYSGQLEEINTDKS